MFFRKKIVKLNYAFQYNGLNVQYLQGFHLSKHKIESFLVGTHVQAIYHTKFRVHSSSFMQQSLQLSSVLKGKSHHNVNITCMLLVQVT